MRRKLTEEMEMKANPEGNQNSRERERERRTSVNVYSQSGDYKAKGKERRGVELYRDIE